MPRIAPQKRSSASPKAEPAKSRKKGKKPPASVDESADEQSEGPAVRSRSFIVGVETLRAFFGVTRVTIAEWCKLGAPKRRRGVYDMKEFFEWWKSHISGGGKSRKLSEQRERYLKAEAELKEIAVAKARGLLVPLEDIRPEWAKVVAEIRQGLLSLPVKLPPLVEGLDQARMRAAIKAEVYRLLMAFARGGKHRPAMKV